MPALPLTVFDVNETVLDLETMEPIFQRIFGEINRRHRKCFRGRR
jgi:2-haloacid dehalogenase